MKDQASVIVAKPPTSIHVEVDGVMKTAEVINFSESKSRKVSRSQGLKVSRSQSLKVSRSQGGGSDGGDRGDGATSVTGLKVNVICEAVDS